MIYSVTGELMAKGDQYVVVGVNGVSFKIYTSRRIAGSLKATAPITLFAHLHVREDALELYGFPTKEERDFFEMLISISGVGPKSALSILDVAGLKELSAAIKEGRPDLLTKASGIGRKTAERIIIELRGKVSSSASGTVVAKMESDADLVETLMGLGYRREEAKAALHKVPETVTGLEPRLKEALKLLSRKAL